MNHMTIVCIHMQLLLISQQFKLTIVVRILPHAWKYLGIEMKTTWKHE